MNELRYLIAPQVFDANPGYRRGVVIVDQADNRQPCDALVELLREAEALARATVTGDVAKHPVVMAWRDAYRRFGAKPSEHRSSIEAMLRRVLKPDELPLINPLVNIGNIVSLRHLLPIGMHPMPDLPAEVALRHGKEGDVFVPADGKPGEVPPPGEVVFTNGSQVLTRRWTWRQGAGTRIEPGTTRVFVNVDGLPPIDDVAVRAAMADVAELVAECCQGRIVGSTVLNSENPRLDQSLD